MAPSIQNGEHIRLHAITAATALFHGQIVAVSLSTRERRLLKRIYALPGDKVEISDGKWLLNDEPVNPCGWPRDYQIPERSGLALQIQLRRFEGMVPAGHYILLGDNPYNSLDSLDLGFFARSQITGVQ